MRQLVVKQYHPERFWQVVAVILGLLVVVLAYVCMHTSRSAMDTLYEEFNYIHLFEDGSYTGETLDNERVSGCTPSGKCND